MAVKFLSKEWADKMYEGLKKEFVEEGGVSLGFIQVVEETPDGEDHWMEYTLDNSKFVDFKTGTGDFDDSAPFKVFADYDTYERCIKGELDGKEGLMTGDFALEGNMAKAMALIGTYVRIESVQRSIDTEF